MAKSVEILLNEALAKLEKASATKYKEVCAKINGATPITEKLTTVEAAIADTVKESSPLGLEDIEEAKRDYATLFGVEPRAKATIKETVAPIKKKNGAAENFVEGSPFNRERSGTTITAQETRTATKKEKLVEHMVVGGADPRATRAFLGLQETAPEGLNRRQASEYRFARKCGLSESDSKVLATMPLITRG